MALAPSSFDFSTLNPAPDGPRVQRFDTPVGVFWHKRTRPQSPTLWHWIQAGLSGVLPLKILRRTAGLKMAGGLRGEAERLQKFHDAGFFVPSVESVDDSHIVLTDAGIELKAYLDKICTAQDKPPLLKQAATTLGDLHAAGLVHGRPHLKDFIYDPKTASIGFIDLEENPLLVMDINSARARDIWLFLGSATRFCGDNPELLTTLYVDYCKQCGHAHETKLKYLVRLLRPVRILLSCGLASKMGKDVRQAVMANHCLEMILLKA